LIEKEALTNRMMSLVIFFLCSVYLSSHFSKKLKVVAGDENFKEENYKKLFEFKDDKIDQKNQDDRNHQIKEDPSIKDSPYKRWEVYFSKDLIDFYEEMRFTVSFVVYRK
jgi:hypothetical protein